MCELVWEPEATGGAHIGGFTPTLHMFPQLTPSALTGNSKSNPENTFMVMLAGAGNQWILLKFCTDQPFPFFPKTKCLIFRGKRNGEKKQKQELTLKESSNTCRVQSYSFRRGRKTFSAYTLKIQGHSTCWDWGLIRTGENAPFPCPSYHINEHQVEMTVE